MYYKSRLPRISRVLLLIGACAVTGPMAASAQKAAATTVPGEIILYMQPGTPLATAQAVAAKVNPASVTPLLLADCYVVMLPAARANDQDSATAVAAMKTDAAVRWVNVSPLYKTLQSNPGTIPNDPRFKEQWGHVMINMPQAWTLQKGAVNVNVAVIDSGCDPLHEDFKGQLDPGSYDFADNDSDVTADGSAPAGEFDHGTGTSGVIFALTNNAKGIAGVTWQNMKCVFCKIEKKGVATLDTPAIFNSYAYLLANKDKLHVAVVNMSYGGAGVDPGDVNNPEYVATKQLADAGVLMVASSGNSGSQGNPIEIPSGFKHVISVGAVGPSGKITAYSTFGKVEIAAPGGDSVDSGVPTAGILVLNQNSAYSFEDGTSFASPYVAGVLGLMMSVPGVTPSAARTALFATANHSGLGALPDAHYGYGVMDAYQALLRVSVSVIILDPVGINANGNSTDPSGGSPAPVETFKPTLRVKVANVPCDNLTITIDANGANPIVYSGAAITQNVETGNCTGTNPQYTVLLRPRFPTNAAGQHTVTVMGTNPTSGTTTSDTLTFSLEPHILPAGISMISIPYFESAADSPTGQFRDAPQLLDPTVTLYRWLNNAVVSTAGPSTTSPGYAAFGPGSKNTDASLHPAALPAVPDDTTAPPDTLPIGLGYFVNAPTVISVAEYGKPFNTTPFRIPLHEGWNMIGDPYTFGIPFNGLEVQSGSGTRMTAAAASDQGLILPFLYRYTGGQYLFDTLPGGTLDPWQGYWIYVVPRNAGNITSNSALTMITTPVSVSGAAGRAVHGATSSTTPRVTGAGSWAVRLEATAHNMTDGYNFIGMTRATGTRSQALVPKPPKPAPYISLGMLSGNNAMSYAQDLQPVGGTRDWNVAVDTDQANTDVTITWPDITTLPRNYRLTLTDTATGQTIDLRHDSSYRYNSAHDAGRRSFIVTARPTTRGSRAVLTNIAVNPGRSGGSRASSVFDIGYTVSQDVRVEASILGFNGQVISVVSPTRAVTSGDNHVVWNGRTSRGDVVPAGAYLLELKAITTDNEVTREIRPLIVTGR